MALRFLNSGYFAGKVGIGIETPTAPLDVFGVRAGRDWAINDRAVIRLDSNGAGYPSDILFGHTAAANQTSWTGAYWSLSSRGSSADNKFYFYRASGNPDGSSEAVIMTFDPNLNVGIGATSPVYKLDVRNSGNLFYGQTDLNNNTSVFRLKGNGGASSLFEILADGKVGFGTTNPAQNFVVADATNGNGVELVPGATATIQTYNRGTSTYTNLNIDTLETRVRSFGATIFNNGSGLSESMRVTSDGDVGINTTSPDFKLDVGGTFGVSDLPFNTDSVSVLVADETIGAELITNGNFATDSDWSKGGGWSNIRRNGKRSFSNKQSNGSNG